jgi:hypothetical protein
MSKHSRKPKTSDLAPEDNTQPIPASGPQFSQPARTPDPTKFVVKHGTAADNAAYAILDREPNIPPMAFPVSNDREPSMTLADAIGEEGAAVESAIESAGQIVFHALGDTGNTRSAKDENEVTDKLVSDFSEESPENVPSFCFNLGDVVYNFGEAEYYYDQFYNSYRDYPAPIFAIAGNHDGMVAPNTSTPTLQAFLANFCAFGQPPHRTPEAGNLVRTANVQPAVYFTFEAPFIRIIGLYSNTLEDPGVISSQAGSKKTYPGLPDVQLAFLQAALTRAKTEKKPGAVIIAVHHPPYVAMGDGKSVASHGSSPLMLADIDKCCKAAAFWPHAVLSGHAHNMQRFTRRLGGRETPFVVCGNGGHAHTRLTKKGEATLRTPQVQDTLSNGNDEITFENYDDTDFGYLRIIANAQQLRIEYHPASDGEQSKTPDDVVIVDLESYTLAT